MAARIAPAPIDANLADPGFRSRPMAFDGAPAPTMLLDDPLPSPVAAQVPGLVVQTPIQAFAAALVASRMPTRPVTAAEVRLRTTGAWQAPESPLRLTDRRV